LGLFFDISRRAAPSPSSSSLYCPLYRSIIVW
jgi:hypothetical protein